MRLRVSSCTSILWNRAASRRFFASPSSSNVSQPASSFVTTRNSSKTVGIVGLPNVGKSTLFNALTSTQLAEASNYPFCTIDPNVAKVSVPDQRLDTISSLYQSQKTTRTQIEFVDIAGLVKGAHKGEGRGNKFLANIREVSVLLHVVRCFDDDLITHVENTVDPLRDMRTIHEELLLADMEILEKMREKRARKTKDFAPIHVELIDRTMQVLSDGKPASKVSLTATEWDIFRTFHLITAKPFMYICNVKESDVNGNSYTALVSKHAETEGTPALVISGRIEEEIANTPPSKELSSQDLLNLGGLSESGLQRVIRHSNNLLGLQHFYTAGSNESRAWSIPRGFTAREAAGTIHTDMAKGFIKAEVLSFADLLKYGDERKVKEAGKLRSEGAAYKMQDGDIVYFRFNAH